MRPVCLRKDRLGPGLPAADLMLSRHHRIALTGAAVEMLFDEDRVFAAASMIADPVPDDWQAQDCIEWFNIVLDTHAEVIANGQPVESLFLGDMALARLSDRDRLAIAARFARTADGRDWHERTSLRTLKRHEAQVYLVVAGLGGQGQQTEPMAIAA